MKTDHCNREKLTFQPIAFICLKWYISVYVFWQVKSKWWRKICFSLITRNLLTSIILSLEMWQYLVRLKHSVSFKENLLFCGNQHQINEANYSWIGVLTFLCNFMTGTEISWTFSVSTIEVTAFFRHIQIPWGMRFVLFLLFFLHYSLIFLKFFYCLQLLATWLCYNVKDNLIAVFDFIFGYKRSY